MKKQTILFLLAITLLYSCTEDPVYNDNEQTIITNPTHLTTWKTGQYVDIEWKPRTWEGDTIPDFVTIRLDGNISPYGYEFIEKDVINSGSYRWYIDPAIPYFGDYELFIDSKLSEVFRIEPAVQSFTFLYPQQIDELEVESTYTLRWDNNATLDNQNIKIELYKITGDVYEYYYLISPQTTNTGTYDWLIPTSINESEYQIKIKAIESDDFGISPKFNINQIPPPPPTPDVSEPNSTSVWQTGTIQNIEWLPHNWYSVDIALLASGQTNGTQIATQTSDDGIFEWQIPTNIAAGSYHIRIYLQNSPSFYIESQNFQIE